MARRTFEGEPYRRRYALTSMKDALKKAFCDLALEYAENQRHVCG
jgi:DNA-binding HxlR family transcriptional regulator